VNLTQKIAVAAGALTLTATGIAAASSPPETADKGLTTAEGHVDFELPVAGANAEDSDAIEETEETEETEVEAPEEATEDTAVEGVPGGEHGAVVSAVAHTDFPTGREHGEAVSTVARGDHGPQEDAGDAASAEAESAAGRPATAGGGQGKG
jgi:hypothetical protein